MEKTHTMKNPIIPLLLLIYNFGCAETRPWTKTELVMAGAFAVGQVANYGQVVSVEEKDGWRELNPFVDGIYNEFGRSGLIAYKVLGTGLLFYAADRLPKYRPYILGAANVIVWGFVAHDAWVGVGWRF